MISMAFRDDCHMPIIIRRPNKIPWNQPADPTQIQAIRSYTSGIYCRIPYPQVMPFSHHFAPWAWPLSHHSAIEVSEQLKWTIVNLTQMATDVPAVNDLSRPMVGAPERLKFWNCVCKPRVGKRYINDLILVSRG